MAAQRASSITSRTSTVDVDRCQVAIRESITPRRSTSAAGSTDDMMPLHFPCIAPLIRNCAGELKLSSTAINQRCAEQLILQ